jgi:hypothetical protein
MPLVRDKDGKRLHVKSRLMGESLVSKEFIDKLEIAPQVRLYPDAEFIPEISAKELMEKEQDDLVIERPCLDIIENSEVIESVQVINSMVPGNITKALAGEHVGTVIYKEG